MKKTMNMLSCAASFLALTLLYGCGGGGGGSNSAPVALKFRTYSSITVQQVGAVAFRVTLPAGVTVATTTGNSSIVAPEALALSGTFSSYTAGKLLQASYSSAKPAGSGSDAIRVSLSLAAGKTYPSTGEFLTVKGTAASGSSTTRGNFTLSEVVLGGTGGVDLTSLYKLDFMVK